MVHLWDMALREAPANISRCYDRCHTSAVTKGVPNAFMPGTISCFCYANPPQFRIQVSQEAPYSQRLEGMLS